MDKEPNEGGAAGYQTRKDAGRDAFSPATGAITKSIEKPPIWVWSLSLENRLYRKVSDI